MVRRAAVPERAVGERRGGSAARSGSCGLCSAAFVLGESVVEAPGFGAGVDDVGSVGEPVNDRLGEAGVGEDFRPFAEGEVGGHDQAAAFVAFGEDLEDELGGAVGQGEVAEFVEDDEFGAGVAADDAGELAA